MATRDFHLLRDRAARSRTETWSRADVEALFGVGRATPQTLMKTIGQVQVVGGACRCDERTVSRRQSRTTWLWLRRRKSSECKLRSASLLRS